jgi:hypothetical protein
MNCLYPRFFTNPKLSKMDTSTIIIISVIFVFFISSLISGCGTIVKTNYKTENKKDANVYYYLPESLLKIRSTAKVRVSYNEDKSINGDNCRVIEQTFVVTGEMIADTKHLLALNYTSNWLASDIIKYGVNSKGLLETVNVTAEDRTAQIVAKLAEAPKAILSAAPAKGEGTDRIKEYTQDFLIKASAINKTETTILWTIIVANESGLTDFTTVDAKFTIKTDSPMSTEVLYKPAGTASSKAEELGTFEQLLVSTNKTDNANKEVAGILTRPLKMFSLDISAEGLSAPVSVYIPVADNSKLILVPVKRAPFVKKVNNMTIAEGIVTSNEITNPSSLEGFISIPIDIAKAIVSIPAQLVTFRFDNTTRLTELETAKLTYEKAILANEKYTIGKDQELENVKLELAKTQLTNASALEKSKLDLETAMATAEKARLAAQQELDKLKKEIDELKKVKP